ncbi:hypothetical protein PIB30_079846 [Stylosanthes scabra]|uniref:Uncharacterized protein n=1 Tax=Stylosanthes scabra TaxID=79078 RepID=A0ABU6XP93_9FABA|nr:hypothetical protein [Stylosanthes scabra]
MARKGKEVAFASTPSRSCTTKISNRGRDEGFPTERFDSQLHHDRWKTMEHRGITHERIIHFPDREPDFMHDRIEKLGWGFMYNVFPPINVIMVREFCNNFSAAHQTHVFLWGRRIPFTEDDIRLFLGIDISLPPPGENDMFLTRVAARKHGELDMDLVYQPSDNRCQNFQGMRSTMYGSKICIARTAIGWANNPKFAAVEYDPASIPGHSFNRFDAGFFFRRRQRWHQCPGEERCRVLDALRTMQSSKHGVVGIINNPLAIKQSGQF